MAVVDTVLTIGTAYTLDAQDESTPPLSCGDVAHIALIALRFDGSWSGTLTFQGGAIINGTYVWDPILATNLNSGATATTSTGGASADELWRIDLVGRLACRVYATTVSAGSVTATFNITRG